MNGDDHVTNGRECGGDAAAYVLGALEPAEVEAFRRHIADCGACREEVAAFEPVTDALPAASGRYEVPKGLRRRVLRAVRATPKSPAPGRAARGRPVPILLPLARGPLLAWGAALAAVVALVLAVTLSSGGSNGTRLIQASVAGSSGSAELRISGDRADLIMRGLPQPPAGRIYEVWIQRGHAQPSPTGTLFSVTSTGTAAVGVPSNLPGISAVLVTQEPAGGSLVPTRPPLIVAHVT